MKGSTHTSNQKKKKKEQLEGGTPFWKGGQIQSLKLKPRQWKFTELSVKLS